MTDEQHSLTPADTLMIDNLDTLKALADRRRGRIVSLLHGEPMTVKQLAEELDVPPTKLYYHVNMLEEYGIIRVVETRLVSGIVEKQYQVVAHRFQIARELLAPPEPPQPPAPPSAPGAPGAPQPPKAPQPPQPPGEDAFGFFIHNTLETLYDEIEDSINTGLLRLDKDAPQDKKFRTMSTTMRLSPEKLKEFFERIDELVREYHNFSHENDNRGEQPYAVTLIGFPKVRSLPPDAFDDKA